MKELARISFDIVAAVAETVAFVNSQARPSPTMTSPTTVRSQRLRRYASANSFSNFSKRSSIVIFRLLRVLLFVYPKLPNIKRG